MNARFPIYLTAACLIFAASVHAQDTAEWIVLGDDAGRSFTSTLAESETLSRGEINGFSVVETSNGRTVARLEPSLESLLQGVVHEEHHRCGGYTVHPSREAALAEANNPFYAQQYLERRGLIPGGIDQQAHVLPALDLVDPSKITDTIKWLENLGTRHYQSDAGQQAASTLKSQWESYGAGKSGFTVDLYPHAWKQNSVIATLRGSEKPDEIVVIGAHLDSINAADVTQAPGADDDASGVAAVSEVLRVILNTDFRPKRTLQFMAYAAEEVGLRGSRAIAQAYQQDGKSVIAALQLDMTGFSGSPKDMYFITDYVSLDLTNFLQSLIAEYNVAGPHEITFGETACGYACSDHAAWTGTGTPAAFPFEALFDDYNTHIHSPTDLISNIDTTGAKQAKFAKLGVEFMMEVSKAAGQSQSGGRLGFAWASQPTAANYTPSPNYAYNAANGAITATRSGIGAYEMTFAGLGGHGRAGANVQVTGYGASLNSCKVRSWRSNGDDFRASIRCYRPNGNPVDNRYTVLVTWP